MLGLKRFRNAAIAIAGIVLLRRVQKDRIRPVSLSITHNFSADGGAQSDVCQA